LVTLKKKRQRAIEAHKPVGGSRTVVSDARPSPHCPQRDYIVLEDRQPIGRIRLARERTPPIWV
jgi:hypothetical protein